MTSKMKILFIYPNTMMATLLPIHIPQLSACLKREGFEVKLFDTTYYKTEEKSFEEKKVELLQIKKFSLKESGINYKESDIYADLGSIIEEYQPHLIAISLVEDTLDLGMALLKAVEKYDIPVVAGGVLSYFYAEELISESCIDIVCIGEGEEALVELCQAISQNQDYSNIRNLWVKQPDGQVVRNPLRPLVDLDTLPFLDYDIFEPSRLGRAMHGKVFHMIHVEFQRGCPFDCTYCCAPAIRNKYRESGFNNYFRQKSNKRFINELKYLSNRYKADYIDIGAESILAMNTRSLKELAEMYKREVGIPFWCQSRPETVTEEKISILKDMGCSDMQFGIEQGNEEFRAKMLNRKCSNEQILKAIGIVEQLGIPYSVNNIIGFPDETRDLIFDTIKLNRQINPKTMNCYMLTPYHGTYLRDYSVEHGLLDKDAKTMQALDGADYKYKTISKEELYGLQRTFSIYARFPESDYPLIEKAEKFDEEGNRVFEDLRRIFYERFYD